MNVTKECVVANPTSAIIFLPGRGGEASDLMDLYSDMESLLVGITPNKKVWYPLPRGPNNQEKAVRGCQEMVLKLEEQIKSLSEWYEIALDKIALVGFSAGGVMAIQMAIHMPLAGVVSHSGAILEPENIPPCESQTPLFLTHNVDDEVFTYRDRFVPAHVALYEKGYSVKSSERRMGGHSIGDRHLFNAKEFLKGVLQ
jgi:predicted esterase